MSSTTIPQTFSDLYTDAAQRLRVSSSDSTTVQILKRLINQGNHDVYANHNWPWAERRAVLLTHAVYNTGTIDISASARTTVTGTSTLWNTAVAGMGFNNARAGGKIKIGTEVYTVDTVGGDTSITLASRYVGDAVVAGSYTYYEDEYALASDFWRPIDVRQFSQEFVLPIEGRQSFYRRFPANSSPARPRICTIIDLGPTSSVTPVYKILLHPAPDTVYQIPYRYITTNIAVSSAGVAAENLSADADEPIIPRKYRHALVFYAMSQWYRDRKDDARSQGAASEYVDLVGRMAGDYAPESDRPKLVVARHRRVVPPRRGGRYSTGTWFDEGR